MCLLMYLLKIANTSTLLEYDVVRGNSVVPSLMPCEVSCRLSGLHGKRAG
jgi:hypothetical protein